MSGLAQRLERHRAAHPVQTVKTSAGDFHYTVGGAGARTIVVLHGGGSTAEATHPFCIELEPAFRVVAVDWPDGARSVDDVLAGVDAILATLAVERVSLLGFSMGGMLAQRWAQAHPTRVDSLVLYVSMGPSQRYAKKFARHRRMLALFPGGLLVRASRRAVAKWAAQSAVDDPEAAAFISAQRRDMFDAGKVTKQSLLSDADILIDFFGHDGSSDVVTCPVLIVEAANDRMVDAVERAALKARYPQAQVLTLDATDHFAGVLAPAPVVAALRAFLAG